MDSAIGQRRVMGKMRASIKARRRLLPARRGAAISAGIRIYMRPASIIVASGSVRQDYGTYGYNPYNYRLWNGGKKKEELHNILYIYKYIYIFIYVTFIRTFTSPQSWKRVIVIVRIVTVTFFLERNLIITITILTITFFGHAPICNPNPFADDTGAADPAWPDKRHI